MVNKQILKLRKEGFSFHGAWISKFASKEEMKQFRERAKELRAGGLVVKTVREKDGTALWVRRKEE